MAADEPQIALKPGGPEDSGHGETAGYMADELVGGIVETDGNARH